MARGDEKYRANASGTSFPACSQERTTPIGRLIGLRVRQLSLPEQPILTEAAAHLPGNGPDGALAFDVGPHHS